jgi:hypothetical protein
MRNDQDRGMTSQPTNVDAEAGPGAAKPPALLGIFDLSYQHYALGDLLTSQVNLAIMAIEQGLRENARRGYLPLLCPPPRLRELGTPVPCDGIGRAAACRHQPASEHAD